MVYKFLLTKFFFVVFFTLSSCSYHESKVSKKIIQSDKSKNLILFTDKKLEAVHCDCHPHDSFSDRWLPSFSAHR